MVLVAIVRLIVISFNSKSFIVLFVTDCNFDYLGVGLYYEQWGV